MKSVNAIRNFLILFAFERVGVRHFAIGFDGVAVGEAGVLAEPGLERHRETEIRSEVLLEEGTEVLRADEVRGDGIVEGGGDLAVQGDPFLRLGLGGAEFGEGGADDEGEVVAVVDVADVEVVARALVRRAQDYFAQEGLAGLGDLDIEVVVADQTEEGAVAVDAVVAHHFLDGDVAGAGALVDDVLDEISVASHCFPFLRFEGKEFLRDRQARGAPSRRAYRRATTAPLMLCQTLKRAPGMVAIG